MALRRRSSRLTILATALAVRVATAAATVSFASTSGMLSRSVSPLSSLSVSDPDDNPRPTKRARKAGDEGQKGEEGAKNMQTNRKKAMRTKKEIPEPKPEDFPARMTNRWKIGPHVSSAGGVENAIVNAARVGANAFAIFLKSQRKWDSKPLTDESIAKFKHRMKDFGYSPSHVLPHGSYLVNLGNPDSLKREKSYQCFLDDLKRCEQLGLELYNVHPGSTVGAATTEQSLALIAECINRAHKETESVVIVLENMVRLTVTQAGSGNVIGSRFSELGDIIEQVEDKTRVGVCLDTCECPSKRKMEGYDITTRDGWNATSTPATVLAEFDRDVGMSYLRGMHINDSKAELASKKDRHENIGLGHLGLRTFAHILSDPRTRDIPLILETPAYDVPSSGSAAARERLAAEGMGVWRTEVSVLNRLSGRLPISKENDERDGKSQDGVALKERELEDCRAEIADAVAKASKLRDAKGKKAGGVGGARKGKKRKTRKGTEEEEDELDDHDEGQDGDESCCGSAH
ncbi:AP endonuclease [Lentinus tigrinus ALCF2SS1-7]|uniref:Apurinic-apyrimidinic endonuclease 1 n=1 Tax=Lentinus tigrinus ALCF2SS1-6 TaxID=1328759 RepID=A0A5C2SXJ0_9APHY|nr:AP endonuclease [Lentinus tigrinus ALCF2SS1-6]RPD81418.1 AP endonuclease [Lentinus tigrinus ALCF2SS1-7]